MGPQQLNPLALAIGSAAAVLLVMVIAGLPMMGMMGYGSHQMMYGGFAVAAWFSAALLGGLGGAVCAWIYNAVNAASAGSGAKTSDGR